VALYEEPGGRLIIRGEGSPTAFLILDFLPGSFSADAAQLAAGEVEHWGDRKTSLENGADVEAIDHRKLAIDLSQLPSDHLPDRTGQLVAMWEDGVLLFGVSSSGNRGEAYEPSWRARRYVGPSSPGPERDG
jgi:hypothetical protein